MKIRKADINDVEKMLEIYNYEVVNGVATLDIKPKVLEEWTVWFNKHNNNNPIIVAEDDEVMGYASLSEYREKRLIAQRLNCRYMLVTNIEIVELQRSL